MKCNQPRLGFELVSPCPVPENITITLLKALIVKGYVEVYKIVIIYWFIRLLLLTGFQLTFMLTIIIQINKLINYQRF